ncbi:hypothetical protein SUGI_0554580 [Cryptomeria japonica]|nr:hypothetical protein SUGI_0554580 [Cryptomeria japonica]
MLIPPFCWKIFKFFNVFSECRLLEARNFVYDFVAQEGHSQGLFNQEDSAMADIPFAFLRYAERECGRVYSKERRQEFFVSLIFADKDTVTTGLTWFFWLLTNHPHVEAEILAELQEIKSPYDQDSFCFIFEEIKRMEYLHAAVTEALHLHPTVSIEVTVFKEDDVLSKTA